MRQHSIGNQTEQQLITDYSEGREREGRGREGSGGEGGGGEPLNLSEMK